MGRQDTYNLIRQSVLQLIERSHLFVLLYNNTITIRMQLSAQTQRETIATTLLLWENSSHWLHHHNISFHWKQPVCYLSIKLLFACRYSPPPSIRVPCRG